MEDGLESTKRYICEVKYYGFFASCESSNYRKMMEVKTGIRTSHRDLQIPDNFLGNCWQKLEIFEKEVRESKRRLRIKVF